MATPTLDLKVSGLDCPDCAASLEKAVLSLEGVSAARLIFTTSTLELTPRDPQTVDQVRRLAASMGYEIVSPDGQDEVAGWRGWLRKQRRPLTAALSGLGLALGVLLHLLGGSPTASNVLYLAAIVLAGAAVARAGWVALRTTRSLDMNALMTIAALGAIVVGELPEGAVAMFLFAIGELLEGYSMDRARNAIRALMDLTPARALRVSPDGEQSVPVAELALGERILVRPGERLPMDGSILEGRSGVNQAPITGESVPVDKAVGDEVYAGSINGNGALVVEITRLAQDSTLARIIRMVEEAQSERAPAQRWVDRFARVYTPLVLGIAVLIALVPPLVGLGTWGEWFYRALVLLVISCPCALVISTPVTIVSALARAAQAGVLLKGGRHLEQLAALKVLAFDKTGTLTRGRPYVVKGVCDIESDGHPCNNCDDLVAMAAAVEARSEHALAQAVVDYAREINVIGRFALSGDVTAHVGQGISGLVDGHQVSVGNHAFCHRDGSGADALCESITQAEQQGYTVLVIRDECCGRSCYLAVADPVREGAAQALKQLRAAGIERTIMLTGDNPFIAAGVAEQVGVDEYRAGLLPEDKVQAIDELMAKYAAVGMVGDGVNDAPALARASVGIAMGVAGTDVALETADVALMSDDLLRLPFALRLSRRALGIVRANIIFALALKAVFVGLAVAGRATLWMAVMADVGASLLVILNGLRMLAYRERKVAPGA